jgi:O-antigen ligase
MFMGDPIPLITLRIEPRIWTFASTISLFLSSPIFGVGFTNFIETQGVVVEGVPEAPPPSIEHNHVLAMFAQAGLATAFPYVLSVIALFILLNRTVKRAVEIDEGNKELGILLGGGTISCFIDMNFAARNYTYYWIWFALAASWIRNYGNK